MTKPNTYFLSLLLLVSCGKDNISAPTNKQALTANNTRTWRLARKTLDGTAQFIPACLADDRLTFRLNETYSYDYGSSQCNADEPADYTGDWRFNKAQDSLTFKAMINGRFTERKVKIGKLTARELRLQYPSATSLVEETYY